MERELRELRISDTENIHRKKEEQLPATSMALGEKKIENSMSGRPSSKEADGIFLPTGTNDNPIDLTKSLIQINNFLRRSDARHCEGDENEGPEITQ